MAVKLLRRPRLLCLVDEVDFLCRPNRRRRATPVMISTYENVSDIVTVKTG
jgi:hypothetical protein